MKLKGLTMSRSAVWTYLLVIVLHISVTTGLKQPHIVFILADDYGYHDIGYHGTVIKTPVLDSLAAEGIKLENYYVQPICSPTRSQLMTGRYQIHTGLQHFVIVADQANAVPVTETMLPQKLKESNYATHLVGKWHLGFYKKEYLPQNRGFDTAFGYLSGMGDYWTHHRSGPMPQFPEAEHWLGLDFMDNDRPAWEYVGNYSAFVFRDRANQVIKHHNQSKSLFLYLALQSVHNPLQVPQNYITPYNFIKNADRRTHAGMIACMDEIIGNVIDELKSSGLWNNTLLIFSTDNGGIGAGNNWPLRGHKNELWEGGVRGIGFISGGALPSSLKGTTYKQLMHVSDWFPTLVEGVAGGTIKGLTLDGFNQWLTLQGKQENPRKELLHNIDPLISAEKPHVLDEVTQMPLNDMFSTEMEMPAEFNTSMRAALRVGDWKILTGFPGNGDYTPPPESNIRAFTPINKPGQKVWLFNIAEDPNEYNDLSDEKPEIVNFMISKLKAYYNTSVPVRYPDPSSESNPALHLGIWGPWED